MFTHFDKDKTGEVDRAELQEGLKQMGLKTSRKELMKIFDEFDIDKDGNICLTEFQTAMKRWMAQGTIGGVSDLEPSEKTPFINHLDAMEDFDEESFESDSEESDLLDFSDQQIFIQAMAMITFGTLLVICFSDPMVSAISAFATSTQIPAFFVSFIVVPIASNAAELVSAIQFASKKTKS